MWEFDEGFRRIAGEVDLNLDGFLDLIVGPYRDGHTVTAYAYKPVFSWYGEGLAGSGQVIPRIGTGGEAPRVGNASFEIQVTEALGGALCAIAGSLAQSETSVFGGTIYGDFLTPDAFWVLGLVASGPGGFPGVGTAGLSVAIPNDPALVGLTTYWQGFVFDPGSPLPIGLSHTGGLAVTVVR